MLAQLDFINALVNAEIYINTFLFIKLLSQAQEDSKNRLIDALKILSIVSSC